MGTTTMAKITADIYEHQDGSDDPRSVQGGGGASARRIERRTNSRWLIHAYVTLLTAREGTLFTFRRIRA